MKLYATTEGAKLADGKYISVSKGQGSNRALRTSLTIEQNGKQLEVVNVEAEYNEGKYVISVRLPHHSSHVQKLETNEANNLYSLSTWVGTAYEVESLGWKKKGEKQKGELKCDKCGKDWHGDMNNRCPLVGY